MTLEALRDVVVGVRRVPPERQRGLELRGEVGELVLDALEAADGLTELLTRERVLDRHVEAAPRAAVGVGGEEHEPRVARPVDGAPATGDDDAGRVAER